MAKTTSSCQLLARARGGGQALAKAQKTAIKETPPTRRPVQAV
jgi:hypothetical protein